MCDNWKQKQEICSTCKHNNYKVICDRFVNTDFVKMSGRDGMWEPKE